jgi:FixJ family two-component response regulator
MPVMNGRQLAEKLTQERTGIPVLYLSGHTDDTVVREGILRRDLAFLQKPFKPESLLERIREILRQ